MGLKVEGEEEGPTGDLFLFRSFFWSFPLFPLRDSKRRMSCLVVLRKMVIFME